LAKALPLSKLKASLPTGKVSHSAGLSPRIQTIFASFELPPALAGGIRIESAIGFSQIHLNTSLAKAPILCLSVRMG